MTKKFRWRQIIQVSDNGQGFDPSRVTAERKTGFGLFNIQERLGLFGGRLEITSKLGKGTQVTVYIPIKLKRGKEV